MSEGSFFHQMKAAVIHWKTFSGKRKEPTESIELSGVKEGPVKDSCHAVVKQTEVGLRGYNIEQMWEQCSE